MEDDTVACACFYLPARHMLLFFLHLFVYEWGRRRKGKEVGVGGWIRGDLKDKASHDGRCNRIRDNGAH